MNHKILPRLEAVLLEWKNRNTERKELQGGFLFIFLWLLYCMVYMFTECNCLVMLTKWMTKKKKSVLMCHLKVCLSVAVYVLLFCPFFFKKKHGLFFQSWINTTFSSPPLPSPLQSCEFHHRSLEVESCRSGPGGSSGHSLGVASVRLSTRCSVFSSKPEVSHSDIPGVATCPPAVLPKVREENLQTPYQELSF